jgi:hypothetical protein
MLRLRSRIGVHAALVAVGIVFFAAQLVAITAAAADPQPNARAIERVMQVQDRHTGTLMALPGVVGTATGLDAAGNGVVKVFLAKGGVPGIPANLEGVPVVLEVSGEFFALPKPLGRPGGGKDKRPTVTITSPADGATVSGTATVTANATDDHGVQSVEFLVDGALIDLDSDGSDGWSTTWDTTLVGDGGHTVAAIATDTIGQTGSDTNNVTVANETQLDPTARQPRPVPIGVSTGHPNITAGTIGCRVKDASGNVYALSNNHVYADCNNASIGDNVLQPGPYDGGVDPADAIGTLYDFVPIVFSRYPFPPSTPNTIDAAIALSSTGSLGNATLEHGYGTPSSTTLPANSSLVGRTVIKYGRTTGQTIGSVDAINGAFWVNYGGRKYAYFTGQIVITPGTFSGGGDSGSRVVAPGGDPPVYYPVGLLFAGSSSDTICNPIGPVLSAFDVTIDGE